MAQVRYRANLSAKDFVFSSQNWGRSVILKQFDQNFSRQIVSPTDPDKDIGIPQIFYGHNIMPAAQGFQSVGIKQIVGGPNIPANEVFQILPWENGTTGYYGYFLIQLVSNNGTIVTYNIYGITAFFGVWSYLGTAACPIAAANLRFTSALVGGTTYLYAPLLGCYSYDGTTFSSVTLTGLTASQIIGITQSFGYMIAWSTSAVAWSSTLTPTDFTPSLITGAGGGSVTALKGGINLCSHHTFGFIVFSQLNCVAAIYSGNSRYPFNFREVIGGGGVSTKDQLIDLDSESGNLYAYTSAGVQIVSVTQAQTVFPEVTNYVGGSRFEDFNDATLSFIETDITAGLFYKQLNVVANRYLVISYGITQTTPQIYTHALVYDIAMKRWGKIKFTHVQAFEGLFNNPTLLSVQANARTSFCLLDPNGNIYQVDFSQLATTGGTIILGKYQHARDRLITLEQIDLEYVQNTANLTVNVLPTLDGKTFLSPVPVTAIAATNAPQYPCRVTGMNHSLLIQGVFQLNSLLLTYHANGRR